MTSRVSPQELHDQLLNVQERLLECISEIREIAEADPWNGCWAMGYIVAHLAIVASSDNEWMSKDQNIDDWKARLFFDGEEND